MDMVSKNFRFLYQYYKDKQIALAQMLRVSQGNISDYVNGNKHIPVDILNRISIRYNVSTDDLLNKDLALEYDMPQTIKLEDANNLACSMLPIFTSNVAKNNESFNQAYNVLLTSLQLDNIEELYNKINSLEKAVELFQKAWTEANTYVALSNSISIILLIYMSCNQQAVNIGKELLDKGMLNSYDVERKQLRNPDKATTNNPYEKKQREIFEKYDDTVFENIRHLKSNLHFSELGDFYLAMCNFVGFTEDFMEHEICMQLGMYMLVQLCKLENKYAEKFIESLSLIS